MKRDILCWICGFLAIIGVMALMFQVFEYMPKYSDGEIKCETATVSSMEYKPEYTETSFTSMQCGDTTILVPIFETHPARYIVDFRWQYDPIEIEDQSVYNSVHVGDKVFIRYQEIWKTSHDGTREIYGQRFINVVMDIKTLEKN